MHALFSINRGKLKNIVLIVVLTPVLLFTASFLYATYESTSYDLAPKPYIPTEPKAIKHPKSGTWILEDELVVMANEEEARKIAGLYGGEITFSAPKSYAYQIRFPVSDLRELDTLKNELNDEWPGIKVIYAYLGGPL